MANLTLLDIANLTGNDEVVGLIEENIKYSPEALLFPFRTIRGTTYTTGIRTGLPATSFRNANEGHAPSKSTFRKGLVQCFIFGGQIEIDLAAAKAHEDGVEALQTIEASGIMESAMREIGKQVWYGITEDAKGFPGIKAATPFGGTTAAGDALTINAGGTTATTASSVYAVKYGPRHVQMIGGNNSTFELDEFQKQQITDADGNKLTALVAGLTSWFGLQIGHENCVRRICNLTADSGKGLTDKLLSDMLATLPVGYEPDAIYMNRRSRKQLQQSRTVTLFGQGTNRPNQSNIAPLPTEYDGIPIIVTDSILSTDAIES